jgi:chromosome segregation ATPase
MIGTRGICAAAAALLISGCATSIETCDPKTVADIGTSMACESHFKERLARLQARIDEIEAQAQAENARGDEAAEEADSLGRQVQAEAATLRDIEADISRMKAQLSGMSRTNEAERKIVNAAREQVADAEKQLAEARRGGTPTSEQLQSLRSTIDSKTKALTALNDLYKEVL